MLRRVHAAVALMALTVLVAACGGDATTTATAPASTGSRVSDEVTGAPSGTGAPQEIPEILDFEAPLLGGGTLRGADYAGKDVAFWFWAPW